jgi:hypothetical protein
MSRELGFSVDIERGDPDIRRMTLNLDKSELSPNITKPAL